MGSELPGKTTVAVSSELELEEQLVAVRGGHDRNRKTITYSPSYAREVTNSNTALKKCHSCT